MYDEKVNVFICCIQCLYVCGECGESVTSWVVCNICLGILLYVERICMVVMGFSNKYFRTREAYGIQFAIGDCTSSRLYCIFHAHFICHVVVSFLTKLINLFDIPGVMHVG